jgi:hypothetical protein
LRFQRFFVRVCWGLCDDFVKTVKGCVQFNRINRIFQSNLIQGAFQSLTCRNLLILFVFLLQFLQIQEFIQYSRNCSKFKNQFSWMHSTTINISKSSRNSITWQNPRTNPPQSNSTWPFFLSLETYFSEVVRFCNLSLFVLQLLNLIIRGIWNFQPRLHSHAKEGKQISLCWRKNNPSKPKSP